MILLRILKLIGLALLVPLNLTVLAICVTFWLSLWGGANLAYGAAQGSLPAIARGVSGLARAAGVSSVALRGWGALDGVVPGMERAGNAGEFLGRTSDIGSAAAPVLEDALGGQGPKRYLVASLNDAELFGSGGAPLDIALVQLDQGVPSILTTGSIESKFNPGNLPYDWPREGGLPWYKPDKQYPFANSNFHPNFLLSGPNMISAWHGLDQPTVDGVITVDAVAVAAALRELGPIEVPGFGTLSADNLIRKLLIDSYREYSQRGQEDERHERDDRLRTALLDKVASPGAAVAALRGMWPTIQGRHIQVFMADPKANEVARVIGAQADLATGPGDLVGVFMQSGPSKLAVFQDRRIVSDVRLHPDGSADVRQQVTFANDVPADLAGDRESYRGYLALILRQRVAFRIPQAATKPGVRVVGANPIVPEAGVGPYPDQSGAQVMWQGQDIPPGASSTTEVSYRLPAGTFTDGPNLRYRLTANPQALAQPVTLQVNVSLDSGSWPAGAGSQTGWRLDGTTARWQGTLDRTIELDLGGPSGS